MGFLRGNNNDGEEDGDDVNVNNNPIPSPGTTKLIKLKDSDVDASYIELPSDTIFVESLAQNNNFAKNVAYVPIQRLVSVGEDDDNIIKEKQTHIYSIRPGDNLTATHVAGPIAAPGDSTTTEVTVFGSALSSNGILYMCAFNRNSILALNLNKLPLGAASNPTTKVLCELEIGSISSPNDVCLDPNNESVLYVAGGTYHHDLCYSNYRFSNAANGQIIKIALDASDHHKFTTSVQSDGYNTLAGIEVIDNKLYTAQLFDIVMEEVDNSTSSSTNTESDNNNKGDSGDGTQQQHTDEHKNEREENENDQEDQETKPNPKPKPKPIVAWEGDDGKGQVWLADNVDVFDNHMLLCPAYTVVSKTVVDHVLNRSALATAAALTSQLVSACLTCDESISEALQDPEVTLSFSNTYIKNKKNGQQDTNNNPVRLILMDPTKSQTVHFEIDLHETRASNAPREIRCSINSNKVLGKRDHFNEQVTHAAQMKDSHGQGYVVCINFEQPRILVLKDNIFRKNITSASSS